MLCGAVEKAWIGRRQLWVACGYERGHEGLHHDRKRKDYYWAETIFWDEFERGKIPTKRKVSKDRTTAEHITNTGQVDMFRTSALQVVYEQMMGWIDEEIARCQAEPYFAEF
jgi:hypothetical protein